MTFDRREELMQLSREVKSAHDAYYSTLAKSTNWSDTRETRAALDDAFTQLRACWDQMATDDEIRKLEM